MNSPKTLTFHRHAIFKFKYHLSNILKATCRSFLTIFDYIIYLQLCNNQGFSSQPRLIVRGYHVYYIRVDISLSIHRCQFTTIDSYYCPIESHDYKSPLSTTISQFWLLKSLVICYIAMENGPFIVDLPMNIVFSMVMFVITEGNSHQIPLNPIESP